MKLENIEYAFQDIKTLKELGSKHAALTGLIGGIAGSSLGSIEITIEDQTVSVNKLALLELLQISANKVVAEINSIQDTVEGY